MLPGEIPKEEGRPEAEKRRKPSNGASSQHDSNLIKSGTPVLRWGAQRFHTPQPLSHGLREWVVVISRHLPLSVLPAKQPPAAQAQSSIEESQVLTSGSKKKAEVGGSVGAKGIWAEYHCYSLYSPTRPYWVLMKPRGALLFYAQGERALNLVLHMIYVCMLFHSCFFSCFMALRISFLIYFSTELNSWHYLFSGLELPW